MDDEVFSFNLSLTPKATEGEGYTDTSKVDGKVKLNVGCVQVVYLQKFVMTLVVCFNPHYYLIIKCVLFRMGGVEGSIKQMQSR